MSCSWETSCEAGALYLGGVMTGFRLRVSLQDVECYSSSLMSQRVFLPLIHVIIAYIYMYILHV